MTKLSGSACSANIHFHSCNRLTWQKRRAVFGIEDRTPPEGLLSLENKNCEIFVIQPPLFFIFGNKKPHRCCGRLYPSTSLRNGADACSPVWTGVPLITCVSVQECSEQQIKHVVCKSHTASGILGIPLSFTLSQMFNFNQMLSVHMQMCAHFKIRS